MCLYGKQPANIVWLPMLNMYEITTAEEGTTD